jgi:hypothetical protein
LGVHRWTVFRILWIEFWHARPLHSNTVGLQGSLYASVRFCNSKLELPGRSFWTRVATTRPFRCSRCVPFPLTFGRILWTWVWRDGRSKTGLTQLCQAFKSNGNMNRWA